MGLFWIKILRFFLGSKKFIINHWKVLLGIGIAIIFGFLVYRKVSSLNNEMGILREQNIRYQSQLEKDREDITRLDGIYREAMRQQEELERHYHEDMNNLTQQYTEDMSVLRQEALQSRTRNTRRYTENPSEGTQAISRRFGIQVGE